jgi:hypothetical protein
MRVFLPPWACALALACAAQAHATVRPLTADGIWFTLAVEDQVADSHGVEWIDADNTLNPGYVSALGLAFSIDPGFLGRLLGSTRAVAVQTINGAPLELGPELALVNPVFSRGSFAGTHLVKGSLLQSVLLPDSSTLLNATAGALRLELSDVPGPSSLPLLAGGLGLLTLMLQHRDH